MKANRQRLLTTISVVVDCYYRANTPLDLYHQIGAHIEDMRDILSQELIAGHKRRVAHIPAKNRVRMENLYAKGVALAEKGIIAKRDLEKLR